MRSRSALGIAHRTPLTALGRNIAAASLSPAAFVPSFKVEAALAERGIGSSREVRGRGLLKDCAYLAVEYGRYDEAFEVMLEALGYGPRPAGPSRAEGLDGSP